MHLAAWVGSKASLKTAFEGGWEGESSRCSCQGSACQACSSIQEVSGRSQQRIFNPWSTLPAPWPRKGRVLLVLTHCTCLGFLTTWQCLAWAAKCVHLQICLFLCFTNKHTSGRFRFCLTPSKQCKDHFAQTHQRHVKILVQIVSNYGVSFQLDQSVPNLTCMLHIWSLTS